MCKSCAPLTKVSETDKKSDANRATHWERARERERGGRGVYKEREKWEYNDKLTH